MGLTKEEIRTKQIFFSKWLASSTRNNMSKLQACRGYGYP